MHALTYPPHRGGPTAVDGDVRLTSDPTSINVIRVLRIIYNSSTLYINHTNSGFLNLTPYIEHTDRIYQAYACVRILHTAADETRALYTEYGVYDSEVERRSALLLLICNNSRAVPESSGGAVKPMPQQSRHRREGGQQSHRWITAVLRHVCV